MMKLTAEQLENRRWAIERRKKAALRKTVYQAIDGKDALIVRHVLLLGLNLLERRWSRGSNYFDLDAACNESPNLLLP